MDKVLGEPCVPRGLTSTSRGPAALLSPQLARYTKEGFLHLGALGTTTLLPDTRCLVDNSKSRLPQLLDCDKVKSSLYKRWNFIQVSAPRTGLAAQSMGGCRERPREGQPAKCNPRSPGLRHMDCCTGSGGITGAFPCDTAFRIPAAALGWAGL